MVSFEHGVSAGCDEETQPPFQVPPQKNWLLDFHIPG